MSYIKKLISLLMAGCVLFGLAACSAGETNQGEKTVEVFEETVTEIPEEEKLLQERLPAESISLPYLSGDSLDPYLCTSDTNRLFQPLIFQSLFKTLADGSVEPELCKELSTSNNHVFLLTINEGIYFSDGSELTLEDVRYSVSCAIAPDSYYKSRLSNVVACYVTGDTLVIETQSITPHFTSLLTVPICKSGNPYVGTGLYKKHTDDTGAVTLTPNSFNEHSDELSVRLINLVSYDDILDMVSDFSQKKLAMTCNDFLNTSSPGYAGDYDIWTCPTNTMVYLAYNVNKPIFSLGYSRYAVGRAIDRETIASDIFRGYATPSCLAVPQGHIWYSEIAAEYGDYAPGIITDYLTDRGFRDYENDGIINAETYYGWFNFSFDIVVNAESDYKIQTAKKIAEDLKQYGINAYVRTLVWDDYLTALRTGDFYAYIGEVNLAPDFNLRRLIGTGGALNYSYYDDADMDILMEQGEFNDEYWETFLTCAAISPIVFKNTCVLTQRGTFTNLSPVCGDVLNDFENLEILQS